jgi:hypothetical protein
MAKKITITGAPTDCWYVSVYKLSDPELLGMIKNHYQGRMDEIANDTTLTTSERQEAMDQLFLDNVQSTDLYIWDNCDMSQFFDSLEAAEVYYNKFVNNSTFTNLHILSPDEFAKAMASEEPVSTVYWLKKYLLKLRYRPEPEYRVN